MKLFEIYWTFHMFYNTVQYRDALSSCNCFLVEQGTTACCCSGIKAKVGNQAHSLHSHYGWQEQQDHDRDSKTSLWTVWPRRGQQDHAGNSKTPNISSIIPMGSIISRWISKTKEEQDHYGKQKISKTMMGKDGNGRTKVKVVAAAAWLWKGQ